MNHQNCSSNHQNGSISPKGCSKIPTEQVFEPTGLLHKTPGPHELPGLLYKLPGQILELPRLLFKPLGPL